MAFCALRAVIVIHYILVQNQNCVVFTGTMGRRVPATDWPGEHRKWPIIVMNCHDEQARGEEVCMWE